MDQVSIKSTNIFRCKTVQNLPKFGILVWKQTIWQLWFAPVFKRLLLHRRKLFFPNGEFFRAFYVSRYSN
jgi:hypothetical protein